MTIFLAFPSPRDWQTTLAFGTVGVPTVVPPSEETSSTSVSSTVAPASTGSFSTFTMSPGETRSCFPPDRTTAYIVEPPVLPQSELHNINDRIRTVNSEIAADGGIFIPFRGRGGEGLL